MLFFGMVSAMEKPILYINGTKNRVELNRGKTGMRKIIIMGLFLFFVPYLFGADTIVTKQNKKYHGKVIKITEQGFVIRTVDGTVIVLPKTSVTKIVRDDLVLDLEKGERYRVESKRPFLPFVILGVATGAYAVREFQNYQDHSRRAQDKLDELDSSDPDYTYLLDQSKRSLAYSIVSGLFCIGSFYVALRPLEVRVPLGRINLGATPQGVTLALHF
jgi:hypothetical protein